MLVPVRTRAKFWATCSHCGCTIRHDPPHSIAYHDNTDADFRAFFHEHCARERGQTAASKQPTAAILPFKWSRK
jgi:hypothetical protein